MRARGDALTRRLFVAIWPAPGVVAALAALSRPEEPAVRWTSPEQWHVTLRFLGSVPETDGQRVIDALSALAREQMPRVARVGPATHVLGRRVLVVPVTGVDDLGVRTIESTVAIAGPETRPFRGHLTLARARGDAVPRSLAGAPVDASWTVESLALVRSHLSPKGSRYETVASFPLGG